MVTGVLLVTALVMMVKDQEFRPPGIVTVAGTVAAALFEVIEMT
jgi:hypothetical protein